MSGGMVFRVYREDRSMVSTSGGSVGRGEVVTRRYPPTVGSNKGCYYISDAADYRRPPYICLSPEGSSRTLGDNSSTWLGREISSVPYGSIMREIPSLPQD